MTLATLDTREYVQMLLEEVIGQEANRLSMHLSEIEEEAATLLSHLITFRSNASHGQAEPARHDLVEITLSLEHMLHHIEDAVAILNRELDIDDEDSTGNS